MGIFKDIGKVLNIVPHAAEKYVVRPVTNKALDLVGQGVNKLTGAPSASERAEQQRLMNEQITAYREQTEVAKQEMNVAKDAQVAEKRRIQEKQIRAVRKNSSSRGFLGVSNEDTGTGMNTKLGA